MAADVCAIILDPDPARPHTYNSVLLRSNEYALSTPLLLTALTAKYHVVPVLRPSTTTEVMVALGTATLWLYWPDAVP